MDKRYAFGLSLSEISLSECFTCTYQSSSKSNFRIISPVENFDERIILKCKDMPGIADSDVKPPSFLLFKL